LTSYHGKVTQLGDESAAVCSSCHGAHDILPLSDPNSRVAPQNRAKTCGQCHHNTNQNFVKYVAHMNVLDWRNQPQIFITWLGPRPSFERWTYFEKFDYFGEIWGVFLIGGTGLILWVPTLFTRWLPGWVLNCATVIHSIEALLAASVIFLVHFFNTHLRPGKFPIDMVMMTGQMPESEMIEERGAEYDRLKASGKLEERIVEPVPRGWRTAGAVLGIVAFLFGMALIVLALSTELQKIIY
jgi:hypothetical protein